MSPKSFSPLDDFPAAQRDHPQDGPWPGVAKQQPLQGRRRWRWLGWVALVVVTAVAVGGWAQFGRDHSPIVPTATAPPEATTATPEEGLGEDAGNHGPNDAPSGATGTLLGHRPYGEALATELIPLATHAEIYLRPAAARALETLLTAAQRDGVPLIPLSGFRSQADQHHLFFEVKAMRGEDAVTRAEVSAPPGYSEHHTGYAVDFGDRDRPDLDVQVSFETTAAFRWLQAHASRYNFELSFPRNNAQNIQYEPWHWRFVGDADSLETFYREE